MHGNLRLGTNGIWKLMRHMVLYLLVAGDVLYGTMIFTRDWANKSRKCCACIVLQCLHACTELKSLYPVVSIRSRYGLSRFFYRRACVSRPFSIEVGLGLLNARS